MRFQTTILSFLLAAGAIAQEVPDMPAAVVMPTPKVYFTNNNGAPCGGCKLWSYAAGTTTLQDTYTDNTAGPKNTNPIVLDARGRADIWIAGLAYKFVLEQAPFTGGGGHGTPLWTVDNVSDTTFYYIEHLKFVSDSQLLSFILEGTPTGNVTRTVRSKLSDTVSVKDFGAVCDGTTDDTAALYATAAALPHGGEIVIPNARCRFTATWNVTQPNLTIRGTGVASELYFDPTAPIVAGANDRGVYLVGQFSNNRAVTGSIALGDTSFTGAAPGDLVAGDWIEIEEFDANIGDIVYFDIMKVAGISGSTILTERPFRVAFPGHAQVNYRRFSNPLGNMTVRDLRVTTSRTNVVLALIVAQCIGVTVENVTLDASGKALAFSRTKDVTVRNVRRVRNGTTDEIAQSVDFRLSDSVMGSDGSSGGVSVDLGTAFFSITNNTFDAANTALGIEYGVHDGVITGNTFGYISACCGQANGYGIVARGAQRVVVAHNNLNGAQGALGIGIGFADAGDMAFPIASAGNVIVGNTIRGFPSGRNYDTFLTTDYYDVRDGQAGPYVPGYWQGRISSGMPELGLLLEDDALAHGMTSIGTTKTYLRWQRAATDGSGGALLYGLNNVGSTATAPLRFFGIQGGTIAVPSVMLSGGKKSGTSYTPLGTNDPIAGFSPDSGSAVGVVMGDGRIGLGYNGVAAKPATDRFLDSKFADWRGWKIAKTGVGSWQMDPADTTLLFGTGGTYSAGVTSLGLFQSNGVTGVTITKVVKGSDGNNCNLVFTGGILTSTTCP